MEGQPSGREGMPMVTYENLFGFSLGMIGVAGLVLAFFSLKRKQPPNPYKVSGSFSNACADGGEPSKR